jgi:hypothetical protein
VNSERAVQFRKWATGIIKEFTIKGFAMDDERLKHDGTILGKKYFEEQLQRIREIRLSERKFYQKITDIYATALDYDVTARRPSVSLPPCRTSSTGPSTAKRRRRSSSPAPMPREEHMGLTTWKDAPKGKNPEVRCQHRQELPHGKRNGPALSARLRLPRHGRRHGPAEIPMTMAGLGKRLNRFIAATDREILQDAGKVTAEIAKAHAESEFEKYRIVQDRLYVSDFDDRSLRSNACFGVSNCSGYDLMLPTTLNRVAGAPTRNEHEESSFGFSRIIPTPPCHPVPSVVVPSLPLRLSVFA